jgi:hypothetical protein
MGTRRSFSEWIGEKRRFDLELFGRALSLLGLLFKMQVASQNLKVALSVSD